MPEWQGRVYVPVDAEAEVPLGPRVGTWTHRSCADAVVIEVDEEGKPVRAVAEGGEEISRPLYRVADIDPEIAVSDGSTVFVARGYEGEAMPEELRRLLAGRG